LNPSLEKYTFFVALAPSPPVAMNRVRAVFAASEYAGLSIVIPVPPLASVSLEPGTRAHEAPASVEYIRPVCWVTLSVIALVKRVLLVKRVDDVRNDDENTGTNAVIAVRVMVT
jgi:hypothetical protein